MDLHSVMDILNASMDLIDFSMTVNTLFNWVVVTSVGGIGFIIWKWIKTKKEIRNLNRILYSEIGDIQKELKPLSNCRNKAFNKYDNISEKDRLPDELSFYSDIYSNLGDKLKLLNPECQIKLSRYYNKIATIKEQYKKFKIIHGDLPYCLTVIEMQDLHSSLNTPKILDEILNFLESTEEIYKLGKELMVDL